MTVEFRYLKSGEYDRAARFLNEHWAENHIYVRMKELFDWTFNRSDLWDRDGYSFAVAEDKCEIVGIQGAIPFVFNARGRSSRGIWLVNWMSRPDYRHGVTGLKLLGQFSRPPYDTLISFGHNDTAESIYRALRWHMLDGTPRHFFVMPGATERMARLIRLTYPHWEQDRAWSLASAFTLAKTSKASMTAVNHLPPDWDRFNWSKISADTVGAARDEAYLKWRYLKHPYFKYRFIAAPDGDRAGLAVWRLETVHRATAVGLEEIDKIGRLVEFMPVSRNNSRDLLALFIKDLRDADALGADYYNFNGRFGVWLRDLGFAGIETQPDGVAIPSRFQPLEVEVGRARAAVHTRDTGPTYPFSQDCVWYWTKSDADLDRPN